MSSLPVHSLPLFSTSEKKKIVHLQQPVPPLNIRKPSPIVTFGLLGTTRVPGQEIDSHPPRKTPL